MAELSQSVQLTLVDKLWIKRALEFQLRALSRGRAKEIPGSDIYVLRSKEMDGLVALIGRF